MSSFAFCGASHSSLGDMSAHPCVRRLGLLRSVQDGSVLPLGSACEGEHKRDTECSVEMILKMTASSLMHLIARREGCACNFVQSYIHVGGTQLMSGASLRSRLGPLASWYRFYTPPLTFFILPFFRHAFLLLRLQTLALLNAPRSHPSCHPYIRHQFPVLRSRHLPLLSRCRWVYSPSLPCPWSPPLRWQRFRSL